ncbi:MAG: hypothetical protein C0624_03715 [Desulfuromonas sp.]|nr:MAG: hypothetical protein C0624_03715 [Desulfuromonas sp.]
MFRYFKEYYLLKGKYQDTTQVIAGVGLAGGIFMFWNLLGPLLGILLGRPSNNPTQEYASWKLLLMFLGLPLSIWLAMFAMALLQVLLKKLTLDEAIYFCCRLSYPQNWLKERSDIDIREEKISELDEKLRK